MILKLYRICLALFMGAIASTAEIIYTPTDFYLGYVWQGSEYFDLDVDNNGTVDFTMQASLNYFSGIRSESQNKYLIHPSPPPNTGGRVAALDTDYFISSTTEGTQEEWFGINDWGTFIRILDSGKSGEFLKHRGFVGLEFESTEGTHYGWLDIEGVPNGGSYLIVHGWAYESTPGAGIVAGAIPEPASLILFLIGAWGTWLLRNKNNR